MSSITTEREDLFPPGTSVAAYRATGRSGPLTGAPPGTPVVSAVVPEDGRVTHSGLSSGTSYLLYASVGGQDRYLSVSTPGPPTEAVNDMVVSSTQPDPIVSRTVIWFKVDALGNLLDILSVNP